jgi:hypothetical protein
MCDTHRTVGSSLVCLFTLVDIDQLIDLLVLTGIKAGDSLCMFCESKLCKRLMFHMYLE